MRTGAEQQHAGALAAPAPTRGSTGSRLRVGALAALLAGCGLTLGACGDTLQDQPITPQPLESVMVGSRFPVYWLGTRFDGMRITSVSTDPSAAVTLRYGDCLVGGQLTCVTPVQIVTSPDNSFVPGGAATRAAGTLRGVRVSVAQGGDTLALRTGAVVVSVYARTSALARAAAQTMAPVNEVGAPFAKLPPPRPDTGFDRVPMPEEVLPGVSVPRISAG